MIGLSGFSAGHVRLPGVASSMFGSVRRSRDEMVSVMPCDWGLQAPGQGAIHVESCAAKLQGAIQCIKRPGTSKLRC